MTKFEERRRKLAHLFEQVNKPLSGNQAIHYIGCNNTQFHNMLASVSLGFNVKTHPKNGIFPKLYYVTDMTRILIKTLFGEGLPIDYDKMNSVKSLTRPELGMRIANISHFIINSKKPPTIFEISSETGYALNDIYSTLSSNVFPFKVVKLKVKEKVSPIRYKLKPIGNIDLSEFVGINKQSCSNDKKAKIVSLFFSITQQRCASWL